MKSFLILATLLTLTACCNCMDKPKTAMNNSAMAKQSNMTCSTAKVSGMTCEACAMTVSENLKKLPGVKQVEVDVAAGTVKISSAKETDLKSDEVKTIVEKSGYTFNSLQPHCN